MNRSRSADEPALMAPPVRPAAVQAWASFVMALAIGLSRRRGLRPDTAADVASYGWIGLLEAALRFDAHRGVPFPGFAYPRVIGAMLDGIRRMSPMPRSVHLALARDFPGPASVAEAKSQLQRRGAEAMVHRPNSPDMPLARREGRQALWDAVTSLNGDEQDLIVRLFGLGRQRESGTAIAARLDVHPSAVSRRRQRALERLRRRLQAHA